MGVWAQKGPRATNKKINCKKTRSAQNHKSTSDPIQHSTITDVSTLLIEQFTLPFLMHCL